MLDDDGRRLPAFGPHAHQPEPRAPKNWHERLWAVSLWACSKRVDLMHQGMAFVTVQPHDGRCLKPEA